MSSRSVLIGSLSCDLPQGLLQALGEMPDADVIGPLSRWDELLAAVDREAPQLLVLDRLLWRAASPRRLTPIAPQGPAMRVMMFADVIDVAVVGEAIAYGVHGCVPADSTAAQWANAIQVVLRDDVAMPRKLLAQALAKALDRRRADREAKTDTAAKIEPLTERERDVIRCVTSGMTNKEIAIRLGISGATVKTHLHHVFGKLKVGRRMLLLPGPLSQQ